MIIIVLVTKGAFEDKVLDSLMEAVISSGESETLEACLMCMAIIAEERSTINLPPAVAKRLFRIPSLAQTLQVLSAKCRVERLALGSALTALENIFRGVRIDESVAFVEELAKTTILNESSISVVLRTSLRLLRASEQGSSEHAQLVDLVNHLTDSPGSSRLLQTIMKNDGGDFESLGLSLQTSSEAVGAENSEDEDEEMLDVAEESGIPDISPPKITASSFLLADSFDSFKDTLAAFEQVSVSRHSTSQFLNSAELGRQEAFQTPLFLSFLVQTWSSPTSVPTKVAAIQATSSLIKTLDSGADLQNLLPYLVYALTDGSRAVRRAAAGCISTLSSKAAIAEKAKSYKVWGLTDMYGKPGTKIAALPKGQTSVVLLSALFPILEECVMDSTFVITSLRNLLEGASSSKTHQGHSLKSTTRSSLVAFLASHIAQTPNLRTRLGLLPILNFLGKVVGNTRTNAIIPVVQSWCLLPSSDAEATCQVQKLDMRDTDKKHLATLLAREPESVGLLKAILFEINNDRNELQNLAFDRLIELWPSLRSESRQSVGKELLNAVLKENCTTSFDESRRSRSLEALRTVQLDTATLLEFLESVPSAVQMPEGPPAKKRRRSSRNEIARVELNSSEDVNRLLRRLTLVLELIEGSNPGAHTLLLRNLFSILGDLQQLKQQSGSDLVYLQSLILGSLTPMVNTLKVGEQFTLAELGLTRIRISKTRPTFNHLSAPTYLSTAFDTHLARKSRMRPSCSSRAWPRGFRTSCYTISCQFLPSLALHF
jgi:U3 small nucleolar RNA-associated protein 10